jgi:Na+/H+-dicarboxylate symporter
MAFTVGAFGVGSLVNLIELIATFYLTSILFVLVVLGTLPGSPDSRSFASSPISRMNC